jgi:hypothetical protein
VIVAREVPHSSSRHTESTSNRNFQPTKTSDIARDVQRRKNSVLIRALTPNEFRKTKAKVVERETGTEKLRPANDLNIPVPEPSPWMIFKSSRTNAAGYSNSISPDEELHLQKQRVMTLELRCQKQWEQTPRLQRIDLLVPEEQEMVDKLARPGISPKDERLMLNQMRRLSYQKQSKILECVKALKDSGRAGK